ncbi:MAG: MerR family transcriptional regulator [Cyclobacteriaceae bacterium]|nr:MerR family transcriptional regulator [Cyclobacteriaceae bacterium]
MLIGELSSRCGLSRDTIRFYEKHGLIAVGKKERRYNNYKEYSEETLQRLMSIKLIKSFGFTLNEVSEVLDMIDVNEATCNNMSDKIENKVKRIDEKIQELINVRTLMLNGLKSCQESSCNPSAPYDNCPIIVPKL